VEDLVRHLGGIYWWVASHAGRGVTSAPEQVDRSGPSVVDVLAWWDEQYARLCTRLDSLDPGAPAWNWAPQPKKAEVGHGRMAHEAAVHRWDRQIALGLSAPIEAKLAADGIAEVIDTWLPAGRRGGPLDRYGVVALRATDIETVWDVRLRGEGVALLDTDTLFDDDHHERAVATGTASDLMLALWGRVPFA